LGEKTARASTGSDELRIFRVNRSACPFEGSNYSARSRPQSLTHVSELSGQERHLAFMVNRRDLIHFSLCAAGVLLPTALRAEGDRDQDEARRAVERGEALPLFDILARVRSELGGEVVSVSFKRRRDRWIYEFKVVGVTGQLSEIYVDATSAEILKREEH